MPTKTTKLTSSRSKRSGLFSPSSRSNAKSSDEKEDDTNGGAGKGVIGNSSVDVSSPCSANGSDKQNLGVENASLEMSMVRTTVVQALALSVQEWSDLGIGDNPSIAAPTSISVAVDRLTALFLIRIVAIVAPLGSFRDLSTATICRAVLIENSTFPQTINALAVKKLKLFICFILKNYNDLPYHSFQHAYQAVISTNKLMDIMLTHAADNRQSARSTPTFGLRHDPVLLCAMLFAALIHDVGHSGVTNRQLILEGGPDALLYNDQSIQEQRSLKIAFEELLKNKYSQLYSLMFPTEVLYHRFRLVVIDAVLATDIASPEQAQISKAKWKEAFGDTTDNTHLLGIAGGGRRGSLTSDISMPRIPHDSRHVSRNMSIGSTVSDVTTDSYLRMKQKTQQKEYNNKSKDNNVSSNGYSTSSRVVAAGASPTIHISNNTMNRRLSNQSVDSMYSDFGTDSVYQQRAHLNTRTLRRRASNQSVDSMYSDFGMDSVYQQQRGSLAQTQRRRASNQSVDSMYSDFGSDSLYHMKCNINGNGVKEGTIIAGDVNEIYAVDGDNEKAGALFHLTRQNSICRNIRRASTHTYQTRDSEAFNSIVADSVGLAQKRRNQVGNSKILGNDISVSDDREDNSLISDIDSNGVVKESGERQGFQYEYGEYDDESDSSLSLTPPSSEDEFDGVVITGVTLSNKITIDEFKPPVDTIVRDIRIDRCASNGSIFRKAPVRTQTPPPNNVRGRTKVSGPRIAHLMSHTPPLRRASTGNLPMRFGPLTGQSIDENCVSDVKLKENTGDRKPNRKRLGIRRSMDLGGEAIENYARLGSIGGLSTVTDQEFLDYDEPDDLKAAIVIECIIKAADVAHNFQRWDNMALWMSRLHKEVFQAHKAGRGHDPRPNWFDNQIRIIESYLMPLANRLEHIGVFGDAVGPLFAKNLESNHDSWMVKGFDLTLAWQQDEQPASPVEIDRYFI